MWSSTDSISPSRHPGVVCVHFSCYSFNTQQYPSVGAKRNIHIYYNGHKGQSISVNNAKVKIILITYTKTDVPPPTANACTYIPRSVGSMCKYIHIYRVNHICYKHTTTRPPNQSRANYNHGILG